MKTDSTLSPTVEALTEVWGDLARHAEEVTGVTLPPVQVVIQRSDTKRGTKLGHITTRPVWEGSGEHRHEVVITGECLRRSPVEIFGTLAHECAHAVNIAKGVKDTDSNGRHNRKFKDTAESVFGLLITEAGSLGWTATAVPEETVRRSKVQINRIADAVTAVALTPLPAPTGTGKGEGSGEEGDGDGETEPKKRDKNLLSLSCECGNKVRASRKVADMGITCKGCGTDYKEVVKD